MKKLKVFDGFVNDEEGDEEELKSTLEEAKQISKDEGVVQHVEFTGKNYRISNWFDSDKTVASFTNGERTF